MERIAFFSLLIVSIVYADIFESNCLSCHTNKKDLKLFMSEYTLKYSSEKSIKDALFKFLKSPSSNKSIMPYEFIKKYGFKDDSTLSDKELKKAIDIYYEQYSLKNFIR